MADIFHDIREILNSIENYHDSITLRHEQSTGKLMFVLANALGMDDEACVALQKVGSLHDIGKLTLPASILEKPGSLNALERETIELHPKIGYDLIKKVENPLMELAGLVVLNHHEAFDGSGYPNGLKGDEIPREAQICSVCDVYDALRSHRPYRLHKDSHREAMKKIMASDSGGMAHKFDPAILAIFASIEDKIEVAFLESISGTDTDDSVRF